MRFTVKGFFQVILPLALLATLGWMSDATLPGNGRTSLSAAPLSPPGDRMAAFNELDLYANIETMGLVVRGEDLPDTAELIYRRSSDTIWRSGHPLVRIDDGSLVGSLFGLSPGTSYSVNVVAGASEISGSTTTQPDELPFTPLSTVYVDDDAPAGGDGSALAPFQTIQEGVDHADAGTRVLVADGVYRETVSFPTSGSEGLWIQVMAEGDGAILDGAEHLAPDIWTPHASEPGVWFTDIGETTWYLARDGERFYRYDSLDGLLAGLGHNDVPMSEGWYVDPAGSTLYVRCLSDPADHTWQVSRLNHAFDVDARDWLWIEGFEIQYYGREEGGQGVYLKNASHVVVRQNKIHNVQGGIFTNWGGGEDRSNDTRIEYNEIYDPPVNEWPWDAVKGTTMEGSAIQVSGHTGAIVRGNEVHHFFNGIYTGRWGDLENPGIAFDTDIYDNRIHHIGDDGLEPEGACINQRFRNNTVDTSLVGISLAPITHGPTWVLRSLYINFTGTSIKWGLDSDGFVRIYHNTIWTDEDDLNAMAIYDSAHNSTMRNNIFQGTRYAFEALDTNLTGHDWDYDNWYTTRGSEGPHFKWENIRYDTIEELCAATGLECNGHEEAPRLRDPDGGDFTLLPWSPNIDRGEFIPGINDDYIGAAPDIGAYEYGSAPSDPARAFLPIISSVSMADAATQNGRTRHRVEPAPSPATASPERSDSKRSGAIPTFVNAAAHCPPLPPPTGPIVTVSTEAQLRDQAYNAAPGTTILVEPGVYYMQGFVHVVHEGITIRGATGQRGDVILDMGGMATGHFGILIEADDVTVANLTIRQASDHGVSIQGNDRPTLYNLHILDTGDQLVKVNPLGDGSEDGLLACSRLEYTTTAPDEYTNGISAHNAHRWVVRDNEWFRIRTPDNTPVPTILFWSGSTDTVVERNLLVDCFQGISFGNSSHGSGDHFGGIVRNNMIYASLPHDVVIEMVHAAGWLVAHNTAFLRNPVMGLDWGMEARFPDSQGVFAYNLTNLEIRPGREGAQATLTGNLTDAEAGWFVSPETGDLHLAGTATAAIDQAVSLAEVTDDFDGDTRPFGPAPDVGADEYGAVAPAAQVWLPCVLRGSQPDDLDPGGGADAP